MEPVVSEVATTFALTKAELAQASRAIRRRQRDSRVFYLFLALVVLLVFGSELVRREGPRYWLLILEVVVLGAMALGVWAYPWLQARQAKDATEQSWRFSPSGAEVRSSLASASLSWQAVRRVVEDPDYFLLFVSDSMAHPIPKRALTVEQQSTLRAGLREWLAQRAQLAG
jgi:hypothetical protein